MFKKALIAAAAVAAMTAATAADFKVGFVDSVRILNESAPAIAAQKKLQSYFKTRTEELNRRYRALQDKGKKFEKDSALLTETQRMIQQRALGEEEREIMRMYRALEEEGNQRRLEESQIINSRASKIIKDIAESQHYDLIVQEAVWKNPKLDITDQVIKRLNTPTK